MMWILVHVYYNTILYTILKNPKYVYYSPPLFSVLKHCLRLSTVYLAKPHLYRLYEMREISQNTSIYEQEKSDVEEIQHP